MLVGKSDSVRRVRKRVTCVDTWDERAPSFEMPSRCPSASCQSISGRPGSDKCSLARYWTGFGAGSAELVIEPCRPTVVLKSRSGYRGNLLETFAAPYDDCTEVYFVKCGYVLHR